MTLVANGSDALVLSYRCRLIILGEGAGCEEAAAEAEGEEEGSVLDDTEEPKPRRGVLAGVRDAEAAAEEEEEEAAEEEAADSFARTGVAGAAAEEEDAADAALADSVMVRVLSGVPSDVPPTAAVEGIGRRDCNGAGRDMGATSEGTVVEQREQRCPMQ